MKVTCTLVVQQDDGYEKVHEIDPITVEYDSQLQDYRPDTAADPVPANRVFIEGLLFQTKERKTKMPEDKKPLFIETQGGAVYGPNGALTLTVHVGALTTGDAIRVMRIVLDALNAEDWGKR